MQINLNGDTCECNEGQNLLSLIEQQGLSNKRIAVEVNLDIVPRSQFETYQLHDGDRVEIVHAIGGG